APTLRLNRGSPPVTRPAQRYRAHSETGTGPSWSKELVRRYSFRALSGASKSHDRQVALPIFACVHCLPVEETTRAPLLRQRDANGISEVTQTSIDEMCSTIQSSAASALSPTRIILTLEIPGGRIGLDPLETTKTLSRRRAATR